MKIPCYFAKYVSLLDDTITKFLTVWYLTYIYHNVTVGSNELKNSVPQWGIKPQSLTFWVSVITARLPRQLCRDIHPPLREACPHTLTKQVSESHNWPPNITVGSDEPKNSVPQWGIEPRSLTFQVSIITTRPPRQLRHDITLSLLMF